MDTLLDVEVLGWSQEEGWQDCGVIAAACGVKTVREHGRRGDFVARFSEPSAYGRPDDFSAALWGAFLRARGTTDA
ncbi:hypothetical protein [Allorhodopirellula solitaria]|uniref:hypothetical protein n=1 Tax=Allorhodopirellula solitaria TaxID=2527987 RepID=UPI0011B6077B|nr:hypothetical protein [Allorhodopirellula solitaria]